MGGAEISAAWCGTWPTQGGRGSRFTKRAAGQRKKAGVINLCNTMSELDFSDSLCTELDNSEFDEVKEYEWKTSISYICRVDR